jgi:protein-S-isoprenylcysteine O-methyltransferase Ste14
MSRRFALEFERSDAGVCPFSRTPGLVTRGPFVVSRNPMYLGLVAMAAGTTIATGVLANIWLPIAFAVWLDYAYILPEERFLRGQFGAVYEDYLRRVPRWVLMGT